MENGKPVDGSIWFYAPNKGAPVFFAVAFLASGLYHAYQACHYQSWRLTGFYVYAAASFTAGNILREVGAFNFSNLGVYIASLVLIFDAPPMLELANYHILGRILYYVPWLSPIHPGRVFTTFGILAVAVETLNGLGASYSANQSLTAKQQDTGHAMLKAALVMQLAIVAAFLVLAGVFHRRVRRAGLRNRGPERALHTLYASTALLAARTVYRVVEYFSIASLRLSDLSRPGFDPLSLSPLIRYEWFFWVFEAAPMLATLVLLNVRHPRRFLPRNNRIYLAPDGVTEIEGPGYKDPRPFWRTLVDPFDLGSMLRGKNRQAQFWEQQEQIEARGVAAGKGREAA